MSNEQEDFLQKICNVVDAATLQYLPPGIKAEDIEVNVRFIKKDNNLFGKNVRFLGNSIFVRLQDIRHDTFSARPGQRASGATEKFLGYEIYWVNIEHISSVHAAKDLDIEGKIEQTCYICIMEDSLHRIIGTPEKFFSCVQDELVEYALLEQGLSFDPADLKTRKSNNDNLL